MTEKPESYVNQTMPDLTVVIVTYDRPVEIRRTITALQEHLHYDGRVHWHLADDGTGGDYVPALVQDYPNLGWSWTITGRGGWGRNVNRALAAVETEHVFLCEDDYVAHDDLDLNAGVLVMDTVRAGIVRYDGLSGHLGLRLTVLEAETTRGVIPYLEIDRDASTHLNVYSNRPHLRHQPRLLAALGPYPEGLPLGQTETTYAHWVREVPDCPPVVILQNGVRRAFDHVGKSRQLTALDVRDGGR